MTLVRHADPRYGPPKENKGDVKDGFYRMQLEPQACPSLAILPPLYEDEEPLVAIPMSTTMGWVQSPATFCTMSETVCDLTNARFKAKLPTPNHRLESLCSAQDDLSPSWEPRARDEEDHTANLALAAVPGVINWDPPDMDPNERAPPSNRPHKGPLGHTDVFVDDFIQVGQGGTKRLRALRNHLLAAVDDVLAQPTPGENRTEALSIKKILKGDSSWSTRKTILGWIIDTVRQTIELPPHRKLELAQIFTDLASSKRVSHKKFQRVLGKLRFVSTAIKGSAGLFSALQLALNRSKKGRIRITDALRSHLNAFASLAASLCRRPTHLAELIPERPAFAGTTDAAKAGMGGIYYDADCQAHLWRFPFPPEVQGALVSESNPTGTITNSDLEHAAVVCQTAIIAHHHDARYSTIQTNTDNTPTVSRVNKGTVTSEGPAAGLCHIACAHQRCHRYCHIAGFLPGGLNVMSDDASRLQHLSDTKLLSHFEQNYPQPRPWLMRHLPPRTASLVVSALVSKLPAVPSPPDSSEARTRPSPDGPDSATKWKSPTPSIRG